MPRRSLSSLSTPDLTSLSSTTMFDYDRTVVAYHGTHRRAANRLVDGEPFSPSNNRDDWLGHGIYFWEYGPQQAWWWARRRYGNDAAVVAALIRLGWCLDFLDPANIETLRAAHDGLEAAFRLAGLPMPRNSNYSKFLDCAVFNWLYRQEESRGAAYDSCRAVFVAARQAQGRSARVFPRSGVFVGGHIQICVREPKNILAVWSVRKDGRYGKDHEETQTDARAAAASPLP